MVVIVVVVAAAAAAASCYHCEKNDFDDSWLPGVNVINKTG